MTDDEPVVGGRYQLGDVLGRGGMAAVRRGVDLRLGRPVAVKTLSLQLASDPTFQERFRREAKAAASLNHPAIAAVYDSGEEPDARTGVSIPYIVMELVEGSTLRDVLRSGGELAPERALELTRGVLQALDHSHAAGVIHRDIKPANVMLTPSGGIKVMDFGIARAVTDTSSSLTQTAAVIGTAQYLSPEQARGESVDLRSDIYSTGCLLYELLVGRPPFVGESSVSVAYQHVREEPVPPSQLNPEVSADVDAITLKALAKDPADRYQTAAEMGADITRVLGGGPATATVPNGRALAAAATPTTVRPRVVPIDDPPPPSPTRTAAGAAAADVEPEPSRSTGRTVLIAVLAFLLLAAVGFGVYQWTAPDDVAGAVTIPDVKGVGKAEADRQLRAAKLAPQFSDVEGKKDDTLNTVISQDPPGGTKVEAGSTVTLEVNVGPMNAEIPEGLVGKDVKRAERTLQNAGFTRVQTKKADDPPKDADEGEVVEVDPDEGSSAALGQEITLTYVGKAAKTTSAPARPPSTSRPSETESTSEKPSDEPTTKPSETDEPSESTKPSGSTKPTTAEPSASGQTGDG